MRTETTRFRLGMESARRRLRPEMPRFGEGPDAVPRARGGRERCVAGTHVRIECEVEKKCKNAEEDKK